MEHPPEVTIVPVELLVESMVDPRESCPVGIDKLPNAFNMGATVLDFAFDIHTEIGRKCTAGKVNSHLVPISQVLQNGDQVEILTTKNQKPSEDWLRFVVTSKAKARIKDLLKEGNKGYVMELVNN